MDYMDTPEWVIEMLPRIEAMHQPPQPAPLGADQTPTIS
jgi:hypothetical protein